MSYDKHRPQHPFVNRQADTEVILASVKEQELQFELLTRELEEEHNTVANQLERCRIKSNIKNAEEEQTEPSDTESRRDSCNDQENRKLLMQKNSSSQPDLHKTFASTSRSNHQHQRPSSVAKVQMDRPQTCPITSDEQHNVYTVTEQFQPYSGIAYPRPYYATPPSNMWMQRQYHPVPFSTPALYHPNHLPHPDAHYHPPSWHANYQVTQQVRGRNSLYEGNHPPLYQHYVPQQIPHVYHFPQNNHQLYYLPKFKQTMPYYHHQMHPIYQHSDDHYREVQRPPPIPSKPKPPPPPPRKSSFLHKASNKQIHYQGKPASSSTSPIPHDARRHPQSSPSRQRQPSTESRHTTYSYMHSHEGDDRIHGGIFHEPANTINAQRKEKASYHHRPLASPRAVNSANLHPLTYTDGYDLFNEREPEILEVFQMLRHPSYQVVSNAAAYVQHITYGDDNMKSIIRKHGVLPLLVNLLHHHVVDVQRNACGALRNMVYGKSNDESKIIVRNCGGISSLAHVLNNTVDHEMKELITGVLWNLSSCEYLKLAIADSAMPVLASCVIIRYVSMLDPNRMAKYYYEDSTDSVPKIADSNHTIDPFWSTLFVNATGCLRNISSAGVEVRKKLRVYDGFVESLLLVIENVIGKSDVDSKGVENCMCILRNLSYRLAVEVEAAHLPLSRNANVEERLKDEECWRRNRKKERCKLRDFEMLVGSASSRRTSHDPVHGAELLWQPEVVRRYLALLTETCNFGTLEAATGALQNLSAGQWVWSANVRTAVRKQKGLPMLVEFLHMDNDRIVTVMCSTLRNMALDERNKQLIGKHAMLDFVDILPNIDRWSHDDNYGLPPLDELPPVINTQKVLLYEAVCGALRELISSSCENATVLYDVGAVPKLIDISRGNSYRYPHRIVKAAGRVLTLMWEYKSLRALLKQRGWTQYHFHLAGVPSIASVGSQVSPFSSPPLSPDELSTPREARSFPTHSSKSATRHVRGHSVGAPFVRPSPHLPYAPMSTSHPKFNSSYYSPQPDANYVMMIKNENDTIPVDSWV